MSRYRYHTKAPLGVKILGALTALDGLSSIAAAGGWLVVAFPVGLFVGLVGLLQIATGYGLWKLEPLSYPLAMALFVLSAITDLASGNVYGAGLSALNAYILYHYRDLF